MATSKKISEAMSTLGSSLKSIAKLATSSRKGKLLTKSSRHKPLIIMGNGPSLRDTMTDSADSLRTHTLMAVNFAANAPEFAGLKPEFYILADPHFADTTDSEVARLIRSINSIDHRMTLLLPLGFDTSVFTSPNLTVRHFPAIGIEGARALRDFAIDRRLGMPRPRNVLVCAIMCAIWLGFREIYITGADHTWTRTLSVNDQNVVVSIQPHFYTESGSEQERVAAVYRDVRIHEILESFSIAFKAYHDIADYARRHGIDIYNSTPGSFIDAFDRRPLP